MEELINVFSGSVGYLELRYSDYPKSKYIIAFKPRGGADCNRAVLLYESNGGNVKEFVGNKFLEYCIKIK